MGRASGVLRACLGRGVGMFSAPVIVAVILTWCCRKFMFLCCEPAQVWMRPTSPWGVASWACPAQLPMYVSTAPLPLTHVHKNETTPSLESLGCCTHGKGRGAHVSPTCFPTRPLPLPHREPCTSLSPSLRCCLPLSCCRVDSSTSCAWVDSHRARLTPRLQPITAARRFEQPVWRAPMSARYMVTLMQLQLPSVKRTRHVPMR